MPLMSPYSDEALEHRAKPDPLDDLIRASPPRERLVARATAAAVGAFLFGALFAPVQYSTAIPVEPADREQAIAADGRVLLRVDETVLDEASRNALAALSPGAAVTLVGATGVTSGRLLSVSGPSAAGVVIAVRLSQPADLGLVPTERAALSIPAGRQSAAVTLVELASRTALD